MDTTESNDLITETTEATLRFYSKQRKEYYVLTVEEMETWRFVFYCFVIPITIVIGLVGNISSFIVLNRKALRSTQTLILLALTFTDTVNLMSALWYCATFTAKYFYREEIENLLNLSYPYFGSLLSVIWGRTSCLLVAVISVERCIIVIAPLRAKIIWTRKVAMVSIAISYVLPIIILIPNLLEYKSERIYEQNSTNYKIGLRLTELGEDRDFYGIVYNVGVAVLRYVPTLVVMCTNIAISIGLWYHTAQRRKLTEDAVSKIASSDLQITKTLLIISLVFFFTTTPGTLILLIQNVDPEYNFPFFRNNAYIAAFIVSYWLDILNSSINFIIYIISNKRFRREYKELLLCCSQKMQRIKHASKYSSKTTSSSTLPTSENKSTSENLSLG
ncbi:hypothetical protein SNE40_017858 [Patella caerulea]|uniref:G-protein coupled receptors family 1 profile domain-containing protein n=1 Tax=Patella caerulea TaxID=87958 RepID=A0AAN8JFP8_PATCE